MEKHWGLWGRKRRGTKGFLEEVRVSCTQDRRDKESLLGRGSSMGLGSQGSWELLEIQKGLPLAGAGGWDWGKEVWRAPG